MSRRQQPKHYRRSPGLSAARGLTIRNLIARMTAAAGRPPTDEELARVLAMTIGRVRRHRAPIEGRRP